MTSLAEIRIRDPFIVPCRAEGKYYLFGSIEHDGGPGFYYYVGHDLAEWAGPFPAFCPPSGFWGADFFWAPECHEYDGWYYLLGTCGTNKPLFRGTAVFRSRTSSPAGPYEEFSDGAVTPRDWMCLDGTLWVEDGQPWMVFCHEWIQAGDGTICALPLSQDLRCAVGKPCELMKASTAPWTTEYVVPGMRGWVTDGPFLYREDGQLRMLWSSMNDRIYTMGRMTSETGRLAGPWIHEPTPIYREDGGHGMYFRDFDGQGHFVLHAPNSVCRGERLVFQRDTKSSEHA